jgi:hypothetical protein
MALSSPRAGSHGLLNELLFAGQNKQYSKGKTRAAHVADV